MTVYEAKQISIMAYLAVKGIDPHGFKGEEYSYHSPFREEKTPSFFVNAKKNVFCDFGTGGDIKGSIIDLVMHLEPNVTTVSDALKYLSIRDYSHTQIKPKSAMIERQKSEIEIISAFGLNDPLLISYVLERGIPKEYAELICHELTYIANGKQYKSLGFPCAGGGWAVRSKGFKAHFGRQNVSFVETGVRVGYYLVFEGFFNYLSYLALKQVPRPQNFGVIVLNSCVNWAKLPCDAVEFHLFLDNDDTGRKTVEKIMNKYDNTIIVDNSVSYGSFKDLNEYLIHKLKL